MPLPVISMYVNGEYSTRTSEIEEPLAAARLIH